MGLRSKIKARLKESVKNLSSLGKVIHEDVEVKGSTGGSLPGPERPKGPLMFQGDHGPVAYRNIEVTPLKK